MVWLCQKAVELPQPVAAAVDVDDVHVMQEAVEDGSGQDLVAREDLRPVAHVLVGGQDDRALLVAGRDEAKEEIGLLPVQGPEPDLVDLCGAAHNSTHVKTLVMWSKGPWPRTRFRRRRPDFT